MSFYINRDGQNCGPYGIDEIKAHLASGSLLPTDLAAAEGGSEWTPLSKLPALAAAPAPPASPPPAPPTSAPLPAPNKPAVDPSAKAAEAAEAVKKASEDALGAFKIFALNPVGGLPDAATALGSTRALSVGIVFGVVTAIAMTLSVYIGPTIISMFAPQGIVGFIKLLLCSALPFASLFAVTYAAAKICRSTASLGDCSFIAGAACLPTGIMVVVAAVLAKIDANLVLAALIFSGSITVLILFSGLTRICKMSERVATLTLPLMLIASGWLTQIVSKIVS